mmetsp:Transcript_21244/g.50125  ORF Transcript_21244/g.50125 Transcript_21244/m.50125 type:complete len:231 (-) Transcript_21244:222-914(-)
MCVARSFIAITALDAAPETPSADRLVVLLFLRRPCDERFFDLEVETLSSPSSSSLDSFSSSLPGSSPPSESLDRPSRMLSKANLTALSPRPLAVQNVDGANSATASRAPKIWMIFLESPTQPPFPSIVNREGDVRDRKRGSKMAFSRAAGSSSFLASSERVYTAYRACSALPSRVHIRRSISWSSSSHFSASPSPFFPEGASERAGAAKAKHWLSKSGIPAWSICFLFLT